MTSKLQPQTWTIVEAGGLAPGPATINAIV